MAEGSSELNEKAEETNNESIALTGTGDLSADTNLERRTDEVVSAADDDDDEEETTDETEEIRAKIEDTRQQMGETIDAIQEKLSFSNISEQVKDEVTEKISDAITTAKKTVYDATIRRVGDVMEIVNRGLSEVSDTRIVGAAREHPLAVTLIGLGLGMLLVNAYRGRSSGTEIGNARRLKSGRDNRSSAIQTARSKVSNVASSAYGSVTDVAGSAYETVGGAASSAVGGVSSAASSAYGGVTNAAGQAYEKVGELGSQAREQYDYYIEENPLAVGAVALALGAAVGLSIPSTRYESQLMGETRDNLLQKAQESAGGLVDKVKQVASEAQKTIGDEAKAQGLTDAAGAGSKSGGGNEKSQSPGLTPKI